MNNLAIQAESIGKRYRIGTNPDASNGRKSNFRWLSNPFGYLADAFRPLSERNAIWALRDVSFDVSHGEVLGIVGKNGAGKSTLLKILSRITEPTTGRAKLHGRVGSLLEVGTGFHPELTGRENIYLNGTILGMRRSEVDARFDEIVAFAEVEKFLATPVKRYSSGMYVRLAFAVAAHLEPEILLVDEVLAVGDVAFQKKCLGKMGDVATHGRTVLFVSHNMLAVQNLCHRAIWLDHGRLVEGGQTADVVASYLASSFRTDQDRVWPDVESAPGNEKVRIHRVRVAPLGGRSNGRITMSSPLRLEVEYWNLIPGEHLHVSLRLMTEQQVAAFTTSSNEGSNGGAFPKGLIRCTCIVPGDLLNQGLHRILLLVVRNEGKVIYRLEDAATFEVLNTGERPGYRYSGEAGAVRPRLEWKTDLVSELAEEPAASE